ncbi:PIN/TRAM domain-containing protein [bacterium]|nr:PIN/TRAM domain-containing protein [bacterium]
MDYLPESKSPIEARARRDRVTIYSLRAIFFASAVGLGLYVAREIKRDDLQFVCMLGAGAIAAFVILVDWLTAESPIGMVSAVVFGLIIGFIAAHLLIGVVSLMGDFEGAPSEPGPRLLKVLRVCLTLVFCFLGVTYILRTKDDVRFIVPYVEFQRKVKGPKPLILDTSALIDGRVVDVAAKNLFDAPLVIPRFVVEELQRVADSGDKTRRARGRRGLERLKALQELTNVDVELSETSVPTATAVDRKLLELTRTRDAKLVTLDFNLVKVCDVEKVPVLNLNELAQALRPPVVPGDRIVLKVVRPGESATQGVGYFEDGTMVVIDRARERIGQEVAAIVTSSIQTSAGRMVFARLEEAQDAARAAQEAPGNGGAPVSPPASAPAKEQQA